MKMPGAHHVKTCRGKTACVHWTETAIKPLRVGERLGLPHQKQGPGKERSSLQRFWAEHSPAHKLRLQKCDRINIYHLMALVSATNTITSMQMQN